MNTLSVGVLIGVAFLLAMLYGLGMRASSTPENATTTPGKAEAPHELRVFGSIPYWDQPRAVAMFKKHIDAYDLISVFWYRVDSDGSIEKYEYAKEDLTLIEYAQANGVQVLALIANLPEEGDWDADAVDAAIRGSKQRTAHVAEIVALVESKGFDGAYIDYEMLRDEQMEDFSLFIAELAEALHAKDKILSVSVHAQELGGETRGQDLVALQSADFISFMTYDQHWETGEPGPVASIEWVKEVLDHALFLGVKREKIFLGIPLYGYDWPEDEDGWGAARGLEYEETMALIEKTGAEVTVDRTAQSPTFTYEAGGVEREVWFENAESFKRKYDLAREYRVGGVMFWRQGREDEGIYDVIE